MFRVILFHYAHNVVFLLGNRMIINFKHSSLVESMCELCGCETSRYRFEKWDEMRPVLFSTPLHSTYFLSCSNGFLSLLGRV